MAATSGQATWHNQPWHNQLGEQLDWYWTEMFRPRLAGLTDEEYFWEPVPGCWSVRPGPDGRMACEWAFPAPEPPPFTTIAWRLAHIGSVVLGMRASNHFGDGSFDIGAIAWPGSAAAAISYVEEGYRAWSAGVAALDEEALAREIGEKEGPYGDQPFAALVLHINREVIHHGAEVATLRDLYRASDGGRTWGGDR
ncbi:DinB family protein [Allokutzneria sp. A3M-2-11 16]|uniref:DinB family protein n=1 Tax=Allokutzneria sp. A3M-2-11 16 TaxID=2962043 RepID=UPI0020B6DEBB|nr:DinB family protein [Allokutzneria sp. A3M-2-11 16]MCP3803715.1 DinB family protein [Allokutzneria sp. A3M-2-11 16]